MSGFWQDLRYGARRLRRSPGFTAVAIVTLALGIGANTALFSVVKAVLLNSLPYREPNRLVTLARGDSEDPEPINTSYASAEDWKERTHSFESIALYRGWGPTVTGTGRPEILRGLRVTANFFTTLGVQPTLGRDFRPADDRPNAWHVVLLSHAYWVARFAGNRKVLGATLWLDGAPFQIVGVLPEDFHSLSFAFGGKPRDVWAPLGYGLALPYACRSCQHLRALARLKSGVSVGQAQAEMSSIQAQLSREFPNDYPPDATILVRRLRDSWVGKVQSALWLLLGATGFVLLIACANIANLLLARAAGRRREVAIRAALGASRVRIARQLVSESLVLSLLGGAGGVLLASWGTSFLVQMAPAAIPRLDDAQLNLSVLIFSFLVSVATGVLMGVVPGLQASRIDQREGLERQGARGVAGGLHSEVRSLLVVSEVALAFVLTVASGLLLKSFLSAVEVNPGYDPRNLFTLDFSLSSPRYDDEKVVIENEREILNRITSLPGVQAAALVDVLPGTAALGGFDRRGFVIQDRPKPDPENASVDTFFVTPDYLRVMKIPLLRGRGFTTADAASPAPVALISETAAREIFPGESPLGRRIQLGARQENRPWATIVGIVGDIRQYGLDSPLTPQAYELYSHQSFTDATVIIRSAMSDDNLLRGAEQQIWAVDGDVPISTPFRMSEIISRSLAQRRFTMLLLGGFGALALLLAAIGIYGVMSYTVEQRTSEIGIRVALGAARGDILGLVSGEGMLRVGLGLFVGLAVSLGVTRLLSSQLFAVGALDPLTFAAVFVLLAGVALLACYIPARRAMQVDPLIALRHE
jgi:putative ABC transport system permease protein